MNVKTERGKNKQTNKQTKQLINFVYRQMIQAKQCDP